MEYLNIFTEFLAGGQAHHLILEVMLILWVLWLISKKNNKHERTLTEMEKDVLIKDFQPEPLVEEMASSHFALKPRIVRGKVGRHVNVDGVKCLNFATHNFLGFIDHPKIEQKSMSAIQSYGVGSCGPRGFYGTSEVHLQLEEQLAKFMGTEDAVVYSYAFSTISSAIPAYAKRRDIVFVDEKVNFAIQKGLDASRSVIKYFKHNDMNDLERVLEDTKQADLKNMKKAMRSRRFLVVEGIYANTGLICPLPQLIQIRSKYKLRLFIDESISFGVLGKTGRGVTEYFGLPISEVDLVMASLEYSLASIGGFCVGTSFIVDHQRLSGLGYCFSASLPPLLVIAASEALSVISAEPQLLERLADLCHTMHDALNSSTVISEHFIVSGDYDSPVHLLILRHSQRPNAISDIIDLCIQEQIAVSRASYLEGTDTSKPTACLRITTCVFHTEVEIHKMVQTVERACLLTFPPGSD